MKMKNMKNMKKNSVKIESLNKEEIESSRVIAVMNNKGGCGMTTTKVAFGLQKARLAIHH